MDSQPKPVAWIRVEDPIHYVRISTGAKLNVLNTAVIDRIKSLIVDIEQDTDARVIVLESDNDRSLIAGADINEMAGLDHEGAERFITGLHGLCESIRNASVPVISKLVGWNLGAGVEVAAACDLRIASSGAMFGMPEIKLGIPSIIHAALLPRLIGRAHANWMLMTGDPVDAAKALSWGLVDEVCDAKELDICVEKLARQLAGYGAAVLRQQKRLLREWDGPRLDSDIQAGINEFASAYLSGEPQQFMRRYQADRVRARQAGSKQS